MMAFGDTYNDKEMLEATEFSYVVANADTQMRQFANYVTDSNDDHGVIKILDQVIQAHDLGETV
jgi:hydroxymethylpyrimidine pyrophosphatase-like HAD family hydrolase